MPTKKPLIFEAINKIMGDIKPIAKGQKNNQQGYNFRGIDDAMNTLSPIMQKHGVFPAIVKAKDIESSEVVSKAGAKGYRTVRRYTVRFYATDGSYIDVISDGEAIDYGDKGSNKAMSVAYREALFKTFIIPFQNDDIENHDHDIKNISEEKPGLCSACGTQGIKAKTTQGRQFTTCPNWKQHKEEGRKFKIVTALRELEGNAKKFDNKLK